MRTPSAVVVASLAFLAIAAPAAAETDPVHPYRLRTGQRVRLWSAAADGPFRATGAVVTAADAHGLTVVVDERTELVAFDDLERLDVRRGWLHLRRAAVIGLVVGAVAGALDEDGDAEDVAKNAALYGAVGAAIGGATAASFWPARWLPVDLESLRAPAPVAQLSFTLRF